jgi:hypothetical protein
MAIYPVCKPVCKTVILSAAIASLAGLIGGCSQLGEANKGIGSQSVAAEGAPTATESEGKGIRTNHDIYHSKALEVPAGKPVPAIAITVEPDREQGWNLYVDTANFTFEPPDSVNGESSTDGGHAYLYINEKPKQRLYGSWLHLPELPPGENKIRVTLNANGHEILTTQDKPIEDFETVKVYDPAAAKAAAEAAE